MSTLHYIYDPLCGWCYGAAPLVAVARQLMPVQAHGGGMMTGANRPRLTPQLRAYIEQADARIARLTGQRFAEPYRLGLLHDERVLLDSEPPTAAILAAEQMAGKGLDMLAQLQLAHYVEGRRIAEPATLTEVASKLGLDPQDFAQVLAQQQESAVQSHIRETQTLMAQVGARGFPSFVLERGGVMQGIDLSRYLGDPTAFQHWLETERERPGAA